MNDDEKAFSSAAVKIWTSEGKVFCPECARTQNNIYKDMVHPIRTVVNAGGSVTAVDSGGTRSSSGPAAGRGVLISLAFACEGGHRFTAIFHFHKGQTDVHIRKGPDFDPESQDWETIWRD